MADANTRETLTELLDSIASKLEKATRDGAKSVTIGDILHMAGRRAYGPLLLIIGLLSVSPASLIPGSTWAFAALTLIIALQLTIGLDHPWLPKRALEVKLPEEKVIAGLGKARGVTKRLDKILRPRWTFLARAPWASVCALVAVAAALITFPLGFIPFAPLLPGLVVIFVGLGLTTRDGLVLGLAFVLIAGSGILVGHALL